MVKIIPLLFVTILIMLTSTAMSKPFDEEVLKTIELIRKQKFAPKKLTRCIVVTVSQAFTQEQVETMTDFQFLTLGNILEVTGYIRQSS